MWRPKNKKLLKVTNLLVTVLGLEPSFEIQINGSLNIAPSSSVGVGGNRESHGKERIGPINSYLEHR